MPMIRITALRDSRRRIKCVDVVNWAHNQERARERKERSEFRQEECENKTCQAEREKLLINKTQQKFRP